MQIETSDFDEVVQDRIKDGQIKKFECCTELTLKMENELMEDERFDLIGCAEVIWTRKILIIAGVFVSIVLGVVICLKSPVIYHAEVVIKVGKKVELLPSASNSPHLVNINKPTDLVESIMLQFGQNTQDGFRYEAAIVPGTSMIKIISKGPDGRTEKYVTELSNRVIGDHLEIVKTSCRLYVLIAKNLKREAEELKEYMAVSVNSLSKEQNIEKQIIKDLSATETNPEGAKNVEVAINFLDVLHKKIVHDESQLRRDRARLGIIQTQLLTQQAFLNNLERDNTTLVGEVENIVIKPNMKRTIVIAGFAGLIIFFFLALFIEFLSGARAEKNDSVLKKGSTGG